AELERERAREATHRPLGRRIPGAIAVAAKARGAVDVHDPTGTVRDHRWDHRLAREKRTDDVQLEDVAELVGRILVARRLDRTSTPVGVDENVNTAERLECLGD